jgi:hypothetical protein
MPSNVEVVAEFAKRNGFRLITHGSCGETEMYCLERDEGQPYEVHHRSLESVAYFLMAQMNGYMTIAYGEMDS